MPSRCRSPEPAASTPAATSSWSAWPGRPRTWLLMAAAAVAAPGHLPQQPRVGRHDLLRRPQPDPRDRVRLRVGEPPARLFNLLPVPPLDGSALLERLLPEAWLPHLVPVPALRAAHLVGPRLLHRRGRDDRAAVLQRAQPLRGRIERATHLVRRFVGALRPGGPSTADDRGCTGCWARRVRPVGEDAGPTTGATRSGSPGASRRASPSPPRPATTGGSPPRCSTTSASSTPAWGVVARVGATLAGAAARARRPRTPGRPDGPHPTGRPVPAAPRARRDPDPAGRRPRRGGPLGRRATTVPTRSPRRAAAGGRRRAPRRRRRLSSRRASGGGAGPRVGTGSAPGR